nr:hypothetical protein [candidate division Zixibacteria bacterium]
MRHLGGMGVSSKTSICPYCKEQITPGALLCKHCGTPLKFPKPKKKVPFWRTAYMLGVYSGIGFMLLMIYLWNKIFS